MHTQVLTQNKIRALNDDTGQIFMQKALRMYTNEIMKAQTPQNPSNILIFHTITVIEVYFSRCYISLAMTVRNMRYEYSKDWNDIHV